MFFFFLLFLILVYIIFRLCCTFLCERRKCRKQQSVNCKNRLGIKTKTVQGERFSFFSLRSSLKMHSPVTFADPSSFLQFNAINPIDLISILRFKVVAFLFKTENKNYLTSNFIYLGYHHFFLFCGIFTHTLFSPFLSLSFLFVFFALVSCICFCP